MKIRSILAILTAAAVLTGCSAGKTTLTESDPYATEPGAPVVIGTSPADPDDPSDTETSSVVSPEIPATGTSTGMARTRTTAT